MHDAYFDEGIFGDSTFDHDEPSIINIQECDGPDLQQITVKHMATTPGKRNKRYLKKSPPKGDWLFSSKVRRALPRVSDRSVSQKRQHIHNLRREQAKNVLSRSRNLKVGRTQSPTDKCLIT